MRRSYQKSNLDMQADVAQLVARLAAVCQAENPRFNRGRFFDACGVAPAAEARRKERAA